MALWEQKRPTIYSLVTGFFPETSPRQTWATNPRPLLVCGVAQDPDNGMYFCRIAYGTTNLKRAHDDDLIIGNISMLNQLGLKHPTRFVVNSGKQMVIMPWTEEFFRPWNGYPTPILSILPEGMQQYLGHLFTELDDLPQF